MRRNVVNTDVCAAAFITGADSKFSDPSQRVLKFLLAQQTSNATIDTTSSPGLAALENTLFIVVSKQSIKIFFSEDALRDERAKEMIDEWPLNVEKIVVPSRKSDDEMEREKIDIFAACIDEVSSKGLSIAIAGSSNLETWPLVQAYALTDVGDPNSGFLSSKYNIVDFESKLDGLFRHIDVHSAASLISGMERQRVHWESIASLYNRRTFKQLWHMSGEAFAEPLLLYWEYGTIRACKAKNLGPSTRSFEDDSLKVIHVTSGDPANGLCAT